MAILGADLYGVTAVSSPSGTAGAAGTRGPAGAPHRGQLSAAPPQMPGTLVAYGTGPNVDVYATPQAPYPVLRMPNPWVLDGDPAVKIQQAFLVVGRPSKGWAEVVLPMRPNGLTGWVRTDQVQVWSDPWRIDISVGAHVMFVHRGAVLVYQGPVATGAPATPTPLGDYYVRVLLRSSDPASAYGPYAYGLSADAANALTTFRGGDGEVGLHGNDDPSALGRSVTQGAVRMDNAEVRALAVVLPLGTPVHIGP